MRRASFRWWCFSTLILVLFSGCQELGLPTGLSESPPAPPGPGSQTEGAATDPDADLVAQAQAQAQRVAGAQDRLAQIQPPRKILWRDVGESSGAGIQAQAVTLSTDTEKPHPTGASQTHGVLPVSGGQAGTHPADSSTTSSPGAMASGSTTPDSAAQAQHREVGAQGATRAQAYAQLLQAVRRSNDSNLSKAITAATLATVGPHGELDWTLLSPLSPRDQQRVKGYHRAVATLRDELLAGGGAVNREAVASRLDEMFGSQPVSIRKIELCEKVMGYGVYDAFPDRTFVAGREQKVIVYVELDNFKPAQRTGDTGGTGYEVRLRQELELYESNGFEVWSHEPVVITDVSQNKRRDFFVVQLVTLPAQLRMGKYHLKIRVYDENAGTRDEASVAITLVADDSLVKRARR